MNIAKTLGILALTLACANAADAKVTAIQKGAKLVVRNEAKTVVIDVEGTGAFGEVAVFAGPTAVLVETFVGVRDIDIKTGEGDDIVNVSGVQIGGSLKVRTGTGTDQFTLDNVLANNGGVLNVYIGGSFDADLGGQPDLHGAGLDRIDWTTSGQGHWITIGKNVTTRGAGRVDLDGVGGSSDSDVGDVRIGGALSIESKTQSFIFLFDVDVGGKTEIELGNAIDSIEIRRSHFTRAFTASLGGGDDFVEFKGASEFNDTSHFDGGKGVDSLKGPALSTFAVLPSVKSVELLP